jgi:hypothetical protein
MSDRSSVLATSMWSVDLRCGCIRVRACACVCVQNPRTSEQDKLKYVRDLASSMGCNSIVTECVVELQTEMRLRKIGEVSRYAAIRLNRRTATLACMRMCICCDGP